MPKPHARSHARKRGVSAQRKCPRGLPTGKDLSRSEIEDLNRVARDYAWVLFGCLQLAAMIEVHPDIIAAVANHRDTPFLRSQKRARPEWVVSFLQNPPSDFAA
jgi:hypothetical protein